MAQVKISELTQGEALDGAELLESVQSGSSVKINVSDIVELALDSIPAASTTEAGLMASADKTKLNGIAASANNYTHPAGDGNLHVPVTGTTNNGKFLTAGATAGSLSWTSVPVATGSTDGLLTGAEKTKLTGIAASANNYTHPAGDGNLHVPATSTTNSGKFLTAGTTAGSLSWTSVPVATESVDGLMAAADKTKLTGIAASANNYTHPTSDGSLHVPATSTTNNGKFLTAGATAGSLSWTSVPVATGSTDGLMAAADKTKLTGIATSANNYVHPTGDGNLHVPVTGTTNNGKFLTAGATAGSLSWTSIPVATASVVGVVRMAAAVTDITDTATATPESVAVKVNELLAALRTAGLLAS